MVELTTRKLRIFNLAVGLFQLITGAAILGITKYERKLPVYTNFISGNDNNKLSAAGFYIPVRTEVFRVPVGVYAGIFLLLSAANHLLTIIPGVNSWYNRLLAENKNVIRWIEYSVSASFMRVMIAQLAGITDLHLLVAIFALTATTMTFGWLMESMNGARLATYAVTSPTQVPQKDVTTPVPYGSVGAPREPQKVDFTPFWLGFIPHIIAWAIIGCYFFVAVKRGSPPSFVYAIIIIVFILDLTFAINQWLQFKQVELFAGFGKAEFFYIILSISSKQLLAWINYGGTNRFQN